MTPKEFSQLRELVYTRSHIFCTDTQKPLFERKVRSRLAAIHCSSFRHYYEFITEHVEGEQEFTKLLDLVAVHETSFFRISGHFTGLENRIFPELIQRPYTSQAPIQIWSAGCSTGEEPYSIVLSFLEMLSNRNLRASETRSLQVIATDISPSVIQKAQSGKFSRKQVQKIRQPLLDKYFTYHNHHYYIHDHVKNFLLFHVFNLADSEHSPKENFDIIFCRNVLIYFDRHAQAKLLERLIHLLPEGGYLFLGDAESIHIFPESAKRLDFMESGNSIIYQKRGV